MLGFHFPPKHHFLFFLLSIIQNLEILEDYNNYNNYYPEPKSSHTDIQKISCLNSNVNVNGIEITQIPQDGILLQNQQMKEQQTQQIHRMVMALQI
jgi:hypothetical protein